MLLLSLSMFNHDKISVPWALIEYDSAFMIAVPDSNKPTGYVSGTTKKQNYSEPAFSSFICTSYILDFGTSNP
jgi:hypothetical protein